MRGSAQQRGAHRDLEAVRRGGRQDALARTLRAAVGRDDGEARPERRREVNGAEAAWAVLVLRDEEAVGGGAVGRRGELEGEVEALRLADDCVEERARLEDRRVSAVEADAASRAHNASAPSYHGRRRRVS